MMSADDRTNARMPWRPLNPAHAIERVRFVVQLKQELPDKLIRQISSKTQREQNETRLQGPTPLQGLRVNFQIVEGRQHIFPPEANTGGAQFTRTSANNLPIEVFSLGGNQLSYETAEYRRWSKFKQRYAKVLQEPVDLILQSLDVEWISLEFLDRFVFDGDRTTAQPAGVLLQASNYLDEDTLSGRNMWHLHRGWFEQTEHGDILINQNFDAVDLPQLGSQEPSRTISVLTKADARALNYRIEAVPIVELLDFLHIQTKMHFVRALVPEMLAAVGIGEDAI